MPPPILNRPNIFEPEFCAHLIGLYERHGGEESGFMREVDGTTVDTPEAARIREANNVRLGEGVGGYRA